MTLRQVQADFSGGTVQGLSFTRRPDALARADFALAAGPTAVADVSTGYFDKGWYVRVDNAVQKVYLAGAHPPFYVEWEAEVELFSFTGVDIDAISFCFDADGYPVVAMERAGHVWIRYWNGASYTLTDLGVGTDPAIVHQAPASPTWREIVLFYELAGEITYRLGSETYAVANDTFIALTAGQTIEGAILDEEDGLHLILATRDSVAGSYALSRISATGSGFCLEPVSNTDEIADGIDTVFVFTSDGELRTTCPVVVDVLLIGAGGDSGGSNGEDTTLWASEAGAGLDPLTDTAPAAHVALGGGAGGYSDQDGAVGASGGAGGAESPSGNAMWTTGGLATIGAGQGNKGGGGRSTWGLLSPRRASSGGGGGWGGPGGSGSFFGAGVAGAGGAVTGWNIRGPAGGRGLYATAFEPESVDTGPIPGGGGAGGVVTLSSLALQAGQVIPITIGGGIVNGAPGKGANSRPGGTIGTGSAGMAVIRVRTESPAAANAVLSGADSTVDDGGYRYHIFLGDGTLTVTTPGVAEVMAVGGGGGGGSGNGGGGGGGEVRIATANLLASSYAVTVGAGGAGGVAGAVGTNGEDSSVGDLVLAQGGGGGAGDGTAAGSRATGGGGHGTAGDGGAGTAMRGAPGGDGGGFALAAGGSAKSAGGGGGAGEEGVVGAENETTGGELADEWDAPSTFDVDIAAQIGEETSASDRGLLHNAVAVKEIMVQGRVLTNHSDAYVGLAANASHPSGVDAAPDGSWARFKQSGNEFNLNGVTIVALGISLGEFYPMQHYCSGTLALQQACLETGSGLYERQTTYPVVGAPTSFGFRSSGGTAGSGRRQCDELMAFASKYLTISNVPAGGSARVLNAAGGTVASASESGGTASIDLLRGAARATEFCPAEGWATVQVLDSGAAVVAEWAGGGVYPGAEMDVSGADLVYLTYGSGEWITGLLQQYDFSSITPGPEHGDGGLGREIPAAWQAAAAGDGGYFGGGGGGGAELVMAGAGGQGGGGDGSVDTAAAGAGTANTGGGGGGSGDAATAGGAGGSGIVVVRVLL